MGQNDVTYLDKKTRNLYKPIIQKTRKGHEVIKYSQLNLQ